MSSWCKTVVAGTYRIRLRAHSNLVVPIAGVAISIKARNLVFTRPYATVLAFLDNAIPIFAHRFFFRAHANLVATAACLAVAVEAFDEIVA
jgi:hypothetical protein